MILEFATKRDVNGNRYYLGIDSESKVYSRDRGYWYGRDDITEITKKDRQKMIEKLEKEGYREEDYLFQWKKGGMRR